MPGQVISAKIDMNGGIRDIAGMKKKIVLVLAAVTGAVHAADFHSAVRLSGGGEPIQMESPGYAAPCWADVTGDGKKDLLVGQYRGGKIRVYDGKEGIEKLGKGEWLMAGSEVAGIAGVW